MNKPEALLMHTLVRVLYVSSLMISHELGKNDHFLQVQSCSTVYGGFTGAVSASVPLNLKNSVSYWGEHERAPHRRAKREKICMYVCLSVSLTQIVLTPIATLYDNGFAGRVQN